MWIDRHVEEGRKVSGNVISKEGIANTLPSIPYENTTLLFDIRSAFTYFDKIRYTEL